MSLLKCPECSKDVSEFAECCPNCGCPISMIKNNVKMSEYCKINDVRYSKERIRTLIKENQLFKFLLDECQLPSREASFFMNVMEFNNDEIPDDYQECLERMIAANKARVAKLEKNKVHCKYCRSTNVKKLKYNFYNFGKEWHCNNCGSDF